jgi:hypothetical protein
MEADFVHFLDYVPYTKSNRKVYSPKLLSMLLQICGYIDTLFKEMAKYKHIAKIPMCDNINRLEKTNYRQFNINLARNAFETIYNLSINNGATLIAKLDWIRDKELTPFADFGQEKNPRWWYDYNSLKHNWALTMTRANMDNVLEALGGAFLLNAVHYPSIKHLWEMEVLKTEYSRNMPEIAFDQVLRRAISLLKPFDYPHRVETELFLFVR